MHYFLFLAYERIYSLKERGSNSKCKSSKNCKNFLYIEMQTFYYSIMGEFYSLQRDERLPVSPKNAFHQHPRSSVLLIEMNVIDSF